MRHFAHNIGDYAAATRHLSFIEDAAYRRLLDRYYQDEKPLPIDIPLICRLVGARTREEKKAVSNILAEFFVVDAGHYHQARCDREIATYRQKVEISRLNGTQGGRPSVPRNNPNGLSVGSEKKANHSPLPTPHSLTTNLTVTPRGPGNPVGSPEAGSQSRLVDENFQPSEADVTGLRKELPWLVGDLYDSRQRDFQDWCAANATRSFNPAATWRGFMRRTKQPRDNVETFDQRRIRECLKVINDC